MALISYFEHNVLRRHQYWTFGLGMPQRASGGLRSEALESGTHV